MSQITEFPVEKEYEKNPGITPEDIKKLRDWLKTQPHLPEKYLTDLDLVISYHCCGCSAEVTKQVLELHYTLRTLFTTFFKDRELDRKVEFALDTVLFAPLEQPTVLGYRAFYLRLLDPDPKNFNFNDVVRTFMILFDLLQYKEGTWKGAVLMIDMDQAVLGHLSRLELMSIRQVLYFLQECMLVILQEVHFLNAPPFMDKLMMMLKPFMSKSLLDIIYIHQVGSSTLDKFVDKRALPKEDGGEYKSRLTIRDEIVSCLKANQGFIRDENRRRVNEALRPSGKKTTVEDIFSIQGSFKKLDID